MIYSQRRQKAIDLLQGLDLEALVLCQPENLRYLCGFTGSDGVLVVTAEQLVFLTDSRYTTQSEQEVCADRIVTYKIKVEAVVRQLQELSVARVGFESGLAFGVATQLQEQGPSDWQWLALGEKLQALRLHKTEAEIASILRATELNRAALAAIETIIRPGAKEADIALALEFSMRKQGADEKAFDIIVASGERGALPHGVASAKPLALGELVTIDFGCRYCGYHSDETITFALGEVAENLHNVFDVVLQAHDLAISAVAPGIALAELDAIAREHIKSSGYGAYFGHGLGHGVGLEVHEAPTVSPRSTLVAEEGMVFTIEPGIYIPGQGGVRIEDMVLVTADSHKILTKIPKTFRNILLS